MALITTAAREELIALVVAMFRAAPGANYLSQLVTAYESGATTAQIAAALSTKAPFNLVYPALQTAEEFAAELVETLLDDGTPQAAKDWATNWVVTNIQSGKSRAQVITEAVQAIRATTNPNYATAQAQLENKVEVATYFSVTQLQSSTDLAALQNVVATVTADDATIQPAKDVVDGTVAENLGVTYNLTTGVDTLNANAGNDTFVATLSTTAGVSTLTALDTINGGAGTNELIINDVSGTPQPGGITVSNIQAVTARSAGAQALDLSTWSSVTQFDSLASNNATLIASATTDVNVSGAVGTISVNGGNNVTVDDSTAGKAITIGDTTGAKGDITVTDSNVGAAAVAVDGGVNVTLNLTGSNASTIKVGADATPIAPTGAVTVTSANKAAAGTDEVLSAITVTGGATVSVTQSATSTAAAADTVGATVTQGAVIVTGDSKTTSVTVNQTKSTTEVLAVVGATGSAETASVKFGNLVANDVLIIGGDGDATLEAGEIAFTASKNLTAAEVAQVFAGLTNPDGQGSAPASYGTYTVAGTASTDLFTSWTSGTASGDTVAFTSTKTLGTGMDVANLVFNLAGTGTAPVVTTTPGVDKATAKNGVLGVITGAVTVEDNATAAITNVSLDGYGTTGIGATGTLSKLATLSLANSGGATAGATNAAVTVDAAGVATLGLTVNNVKGAVSLDGAADNALKTLNLTTSTANSTFALTAASVETLTVAGDKVADVSTGTLSAVKTVTVSGAAGLTLAAANATTLTSVDTTATTGTVTATIKGAAASYAGGAGKDVVTLATDTALTKSISLGGGDDTLSFGALSVTGSTATLSGGDGTDTLSMSTAAAAALDGSVQSFYTAFERLTINDAAAGETIDLANLGFTSYVTTTGGTLTLDKMATGGTVVMAAATTGITVNVKDAATGTADVLNATLSSAGAINGGTLTAANVETVNITSDDTDTTAHVNTLVLTADKATAVTVTGDAGLTLTLTGSTAVTSINGSTLTGALTVTSLNTTSATTITGGTGADVLTAATGTTADVLVGGAGSDTLTANAGLSTLTGGAGNDTFAITVASSNSSSYSTITDFASGDLIQMTGADSFKAAVITLADTAVFQDYVNAAINGVGANDIAWFQYAGNTYVVREDAVDSSSFVNGSDFIVKLTGLVDLSVASFNSTNATISL